MIGAILVIVLMFAVVGIRASYLTLQMTISTSSSKFEDASKFVIGGPIMYPLLAFAMCWMSLQINIHEFQLWRDYIAVVWLILLMGFMVIHTNDLMRKRKLCTTLLEHKRIMLMG
ncbi:MAG: hypothetical protein AAB883_03010 [Patescibacteria group bacterium]